MGFEKFKSFKMQAFKNSQFNIHILRLKPYLCFLFFIPKMDKKTEEFYDRLKGELESSTTWPSAYLFKFIVPTTPTNVEFVHKSFDGLGAVIKTTASKTGKFTSVSIDVMMTDAQQVINKYQEVSVIEGIVSL